MSAWICDSRVWQQGFCNTGLALAGRASLGGLEMKKTMRKWAAIVLAVTIAVAFMPAGFGALEAGAPGSGPGVEKAYAGGGDEVGTIRGIVRDYDSGNTLTNGATVEVGDKLVVLMYEVDKDQNGTTGIPGFENKYNNGEISLYWDLRSSPSDGTVIKEYSKMSLTDSVMFIFTVPAEASGKYIQLWTDETYDNSLDLTGDYFKVKAAPAPAGTGSIDITINSTGIATVTGSTGGSATFTRLWLDKTRSIMSLSGKSFKVTFDTKKYDIGWHELSAELSDGTEIVFPKFFPTAIYDKPVLKASYFETFGKQMVFKCPNYNNYKYKYYLYVKKSSQSWSQAKVYGPFSPVTKTRIIKLTPGTKYNVRAYYLAETKLNGINQVFASLKPSATVTVKTGPKKKPAIKSIKISKAKVKKIKVKGKYYWDNGTLKYLKGFTTYETTYKVTIKFKKKQKIAGLEVYAGGVTLPKFIKGSKKTYTTTFTVGGKAKGKKTLFKIKAKTNKTYAAWSPTYKSKKIRIR